MHIGFQSKKLRAETRGSAALLTAEREWDLVRRWRAEEDARALSELITAHRHLVLGVAKRFRGFDLSFDDLIQEGNAALVQAANRFDLARGVRFSTYAMWWVRAAIQDCVLHNRSIVRRITGGTNRSLFFSLQRLRYGWRVDGKLSGEERERAAVALGVSEQAIEEMEAFLGGADVPALEERDPERINGITLMAEGPSPEERLFKARERRDRRTWLQTALKGLNERERTIIVGRHLSESPRTLRDLGLRFGISAERARQIESAALAKLRDWAAVRPLDAVGAAAALAGT
jgi:RNA polymerase sigma-32 factor